MSRGVSQADDLTDPFAYTARMNRIPDFDDGERSVVESALRERRARRIEIDGSLGAGRGEKK